jgi:hypothetical protein
MTYVTVTHQLTTRPINAHGLDSVLDKPFDDVVAIVPKGCMLLCRSSWPLAIARAQVFHKTRFVTYKNTVNLPAQYSPLTTGKRGDL